jgi:hypothetical protein
MPFYSLFIKQIMSNYCLLASLLACYTSPALSCIFLVDDDRLNRLLSLLLPASLACPIFFKLDVGGVGGESARLGRPAAGAGASLEYGSNMAAEFGIGDVDGGVRFPEVPAAA